MSSFSALSRGLALALGFALAAGAAPAQDAPIRFGVGVDPAYAPMFLAKREKLFEKHGVNVEIVQYTQGGDAVDAMLAAQAEFAGSTEAVTANRVTRGDIRGLAVFSQSGKFIKLVARAGITDVKDIKKWGIVPGSVNEYITGKIISVKGIDPKSVEMVRAGPPEFPALLQRGDVDGYILWEPWPSNGVKVGGKILGSSGDFGYVYNLLIAVNGPWYDKNKDKAVKVAAALAEACKILTADPARGAAAVQAEAKIPAATAEAQMREVDCKVRDFTDQDLVNYKEIAKFLFDKGNTKTLADMDKYVQRGFFKE